MAYRVGFATSTGVFLALFGPAITAWIGCKVLADKPLPLVAPFAQLSLMLICASLLIIIRRYEGLSLASVGLGTLSWKSVAWGGAFAAFLIWIYSPLLGKAMALAGISWFAEGLGKAREIPTWYLAVAILIGATVEEFLYRGYAVERLSWMTGNVWAAGLISALAFGLAHVPMWGWGAAMATVFSGAIATAFYVWRKDLLANIIAHVLTDLTGIVLPLLLSGK